MYVISLQHSQHAQRGDAREGALVDVRDAVPLQYPAEESSH